MARLVQRSVDQSPVCSYLADRPSATASQILLDVTQPELERMLVRGWRRFGPVYFRPACAHCSECVPIRVPVATFEPSRSQRRARKKAEGLRIELGVPRVDEERLALYEAWHATREADRGWNPSRMDEETYSIEFAFPHPAARELAFYEGDRLVGLGLCDETERCWSAAYFFYAPDRRSLSLGVVNVLVQIDLARSLGIPHVYLGFRVLGCPSLRYKAGYRPHELLRGRPGSEEEPVWEPALVE